jgi:hypothetical protein
MTSTSARALPIRAHASGVITLSWWLTSRDDVIEEYSKYADPREMLQSETLTCPHDGHERGLELAHTPGTDVVRARCPGGHIWDTGIAPFAFMVWVDEHDEHGEPLAPVDESGNPIT